MNDFMDWVFKTSWGMDPRYLRKIGELMVKAGNKPEAMSGSDSRPTEDLYTLSNGVATIEMYGVVNKRDTWSWLPTSSCDGLRAAIQMALDDQKCKSIILDIDSPGGSVDGVADVSEFIFNCRGKKPIIAFANGQMASAAYWIGSACDKIVTSQDASVGSIGVYSILMDCSKWLKDMGISEEMIKAGKYKGLGHPDFPITDDARKIAQSEVDAHYENFVGAVARNRGISNSDARALADGRVHIGNDAVKLGLADRVSTLDELQKGAASTGGQPNRPTIQLKSAESLIPIQPTRRDTFKSLINVTDRVLSVRFPEDSRPIGRGNERRIKMSEQVNTPVVSPASNVISLRDISVEDIKTNHPDLYSRIGKDFARAENDRQDGIKAMIKDSGCDEQLAATLFVGCKDMSNEDASREIGRVTSIEAALQSAKIAGLDEEDLKALRADVKGLPQITAVRHIQSFVNVKKGANTRLVNTPALVLTGNDPVTPAVAPQVVTIKTGVEAARKEYKENFVGANKGVMGLVEKDYVEQALQDAKIEYTDADLKAIAPDLFK